MVVLQLKLGDVLGDQIGVTIQENSAVVAMEQLRVVLDGYNSLGDDDDDDDGPDGKKTPWFKPPTMN